MPSVSSRPRDFVGVVGPDAEDYLQRMLSNDVAALAPGESCDALLLTAKARVIAPLRVLRRGPDDFLLLTDPGLGERVERELVRMRFAARARVAREEHRAWIVLGDGADGLPAPEYGGGAAEVLDDEPQGEQAGEAELERRRIEAARPAYGREIDDRILPAEAGLVDTHVSLTKGCYPGQEPIARLHYRGHANRRLRRLRIEGADPVAYDAPVLHGEKAVGRVTSAVPDAGATLALGYVRVEVPDDAELSVEGRPARLH